MKGIRIIALVGALFSVVSLSAQVTVDAKIDSTRIFIGQQVGIAVEVSADAGKSVEFAHYDSLQQIRSKSSMRRRSVRADATRNASTI